MTQKTVTYEDSGVDYGAMDPFKQACQLAALKTAANIARLNNGEFIEVEASRGESAYLIEAAKSYFAHVEEGLGTKNKVADAMYALTGKSYYDAVAQCTVAMIVNDLINGWKHACDLARCNWSGGETPTLRGIVEPGTALLSGSAMGLIKPKSNRIMGNIVHGDCIVMLSSSGVHANGLTLCRQIADGLPDGYMTKMPGTDQTYGEALLTPTEIYVPVIEDLQREGVEIHYAVNVTGHGWRKLMRAREPFVYIVERPPDPQPVFRFIQEHGPVAERDMYGDYNMGTGFALYVPAEQGTRATTIAQKHVNAWEAGHVEKDGDAKRVVIKPKDIIFEADTLSVR